MSTSEPKMSVEPILTLEELMLKEQAAEEEILSYKERVTWNLQKFQQEWVEEQRAMLGVREVGSPPNPVVLAAKLIDEDDNG